ncbi:penicillin-binding protein activator [Lysobacter sp. A3-1-A15]|uniref:penicillin-binding protein activator n=1 Tax=Novilysobacter viscosus TaxID=3098602 RepID=UPI002EDADF7E
MRRATSPTVRLLLAAMMVSLLAGCGAVPTRAPAPPPVVQDPAIAQAAQLAREATFLSGPARSQAETRIGALLSQLDDATLAREAAALADGDPFYNYVGRALLRRGLPLPRPFDRPQWQFDAGNRPPADSDGYRPPVRLAVLLPLSGDLATAASPVRDGLLAGYYGERRRRPEIEFIDTHGTAGGTLSAYDRAVAEGHDFVLGPLGRDEVDALFGRGTLQVPVLALNRGSVAPPPGNASFALSPEDEGAAAADYLLERGARRVLAVGGESDTQQRAIAAMRERLAEGGGVVTDVVGARTEDFALFAQKEGGVDAVFLAVRGEDAHGVVPKLAMAGLAGKPRVATSQLLSGTGDPARDSVLDGIAFPTIAWNNRSVRGLPSLDRAAATLPTAKGGGARLFAFGFDAWLLTAYLEHLALAADGRVEGATGTLRIDGFGHVQRTPAWSTFIGGRQVPLAGAER